MSNDNDTIVDDVTCEKPLRGSDYFAKTTHAPILLRMTADMFRQHSDLFLQQAATLERISSSPANPDCWNFTESSPEAIQTSIHQEQLKILAVKSYESMCQVQKRVDYIERLVMRNGIGMKIIPKVRKAPLPKLHANKAMKATTPMFWFSQDHGERIAQDFGSSHVKHELTKLWTSMNPAQRKPYILKAAIMKNKKPAVTKEGKQLVQKQEESEDDDEPKVIFAKKLPNSNDESSSSSYDSDELSIHETL